MGDDKPPHHLEFESIGNLPDEHSILAARAALKARTADPHAHEAASSDMNRPRKRSRRRRYAAWQSELWGQPAATILLGILIVSAPQLLGGVLPWTINTIAALSVVCLALIGLRAPIAGNRVPRVAIVMTLAWAWTALQALPLPCGWVAMLAPDSARALRAAPLIMRDASPAYCTLSQDPGATHEELVKGAAIMATFLTCWLFAASGGRRRLFWLVAISTFAMSVIALAHGLFEVDRVFGLYKPLGLTRTLLLAPLMNLNNLGAFVALGVPLWIGLSYRAPDPNVRLLGYVAIAMTTTTAVLTLSRGAMGQLIAGVAAVLFLIWRQRSKDKPKQQAELQLRGLSLGIAGACGLGVAAYLVGSDALHEMRNTDLGKLELAAHALRYAFAHPWTGMGRGAFGSVFVAQEGSIARYRYAENFVAHWAAEWGVVIALALLLAIAVALWRATKATSSVAHLSAIAALCALCAQNLVDFGFEMLGIAVVAAALLAACLAPSADGATAADEASAATPWRSTYLLSFMVLLGAAAALAGLGPRIVRESIPALENKLYELDTRGDRAGFARQLRSALALHPSEPTLTLMAASESIAHKDPRSGAWVNRALQVAPGWARPHALAFRWLWQRGQGQQALLELRAAAEIDPNVVIEDVCRLGLGKAEWVLSSAPHNRQRRNFLERAANCIAPYPAGPVLDRVIMREFPDSVYAAQRSAELQLREGHVDQSLATLDALLRRRPGALDVVVLRFQILLQAGRLSDVIDKVDAALPGLDEARQAQILGIKALAFARAGSQDLALEAVSNVRRRATSDAIRLAASYELEGQIHLQLKQPGEALTAFREAYRVSTETKYLQTIASIAESLGDRPQALWAYINLCQREPTGGGCERRNALLSPHDVNSAQ